ncbi:hypothetical protein NE865_13713 [Phthorimaea operculella]|nr:hypothetical protein NE865_13713 [Phthorimaea operculella]
MPTLDDEPEQKEQKEQNQDKENQEQTEGDNGKIVSKEKEEEKSTDVDKGWSLHYDIEWNIPRLDDEPEQKEQKEQNQDKENQEQTEGDNGKIVSKEDKEEKSTDVDKGDNGKIVSKDEKEEKSTDVDKDWSRHYDGWNIPRLDDEPEQKEQNQDKENQEQTEGDNGKIVSKEDKEEKSTDVDKDDEPEQKEQNQDKENQEQTERDNGKIVSKEEKEEKSTDVDKGQYQRYIHQMPTLDDEPEQKEQKEQNQDKENQEQTEGDNGKIVSKEDKEEKSTDVDKEEAESPFGSQDPTEPKWTETADGQIEVEDPDDYLIYLTDILSRIHTHFYEIYDKADGKQIPDLKLVIPEVKSKVLTGCSLVFSGLVPTHQKLHTSRAYQVAKSLGAEVTQDYTENTTHLVAVRSGTAKVNASRKQGEGKNKLHVVTPDWLWACAERWERVDERLYPLQRGGQSDYHLIVRKNWIFARSKAAPTLGVGRAFAFPERTAGVGAALTSRQRTVCGAWASRCQAPRERCVNAAQTPRLRRVPRAFRRGGGMFAGGTGGRTPVESDVSAASARRSRSARAALDNAKPAPRKRCADATSAPRRRRQYAQETRTLGQRPMWGQPNFYLKIITVSLIV